MKKFLLLSALPLMLATFATQQVHAEVDHDESYDALRLQPSEDPTLPTDPNNPGITVDPMNQDGTRPNPGTGGQLSLDFASSFDFGVNKISNADAIYYAQAQHYFNDDKLVTPDFAQVTDNRGTLGGWTLKVKEAQQFQADRPVEYSQLTGASISLLKPQLVSVSDSPEPTTREVIDLVPDQESIVTEASTGQGAGTWITRWGDQGDLFEKKVIVDGKEEKKAFTQAVQLFVPGSTPKDPVNYKTTLIWTLSDMPSNN